MNPLRVDGESTDWRCLSDLPSSSDSSGRSRGDDDKEVVVDDVDEGRKKAMKL